MNYVVAVLVILGVADALIGFDCGGDRLNVTTISLNSIEECGTTIESVRTEEVYAQLLQLLEFDQVYVRQCKVEITKIVYYCGMHSHVSVV